MLLGTEYAKLKNKCLARTSPYSVINAVIIVQCDAGTMREKKMHAIMGAHKVKLD